jgi:lysophospholipase L1-like esterase
VDILGGIALGAGVVALSGALTVALTVRAFRVLKRPPAHSTAAFLADPGPDRRPGRPVVACVGASTVHGNTGFDFVAELARRHGDQYRFVNAGFNGDTAQNVLDRLDEVVAAQPDYAIVLVGGNDLVAIHQLLIPRIGRTDTPPEHTLDRYVEHLTRIVTRLKSETPATVALMSISVVGEDLNSTFNSYADGLNELMRRVAREQGVDYIPFNEELKSELARLDHTHGKNFADSPIPLLRAVWLRYVLGLPFDLIARLHGYRLLVDGMHLNSRGGRVAADQIDRWLTTVTSTPHP